MKTLEVIKYSLIALAMIGCSTSDIKEVSIHNSAIILVEAESFTNSSSEIIANDTIVQVAENQWLSYKMEVAVAGRYKIEVNALADKNATLWVEDYSDNKDNRTYDITGKMSFEMKLSEPSFRVGSKEGAPLNVGTHHIKIHTSEGILTIDWIKFTLIKELELTQTVFEQNIDGKSWELTWSDEFEGDGLPDTTKWAYNTGNWGWGNNEPQYYTEKEIENAQQKDGNLIIKAIRDKRTNGWTSARLTTQGRVSFLYGKIEFRAKVPAGKGTWAAGWLLGDDFKDELSWPYCGEIDVLECVGFEIDDNTGNGLNHASCHTRAYYFKQNNQISAEVPVENMVDEFHTYAIEWYPDVIYALMDGERYFTYDKTANELEWPFFKPQNIIINLAVGGGWGGIMGIDANLDSHEYIIDYVRVYELN